MNLPVFTRRPLLAAGSIACALFLLAGCTGGGRTSLIPNSDPALRKDSTEFSADAAKRPFKADTPRGDAAEAPSRAQVHYGLLEKIEFTNLSQTDDYQNIEIWLDRQYVVFVPKAARGELKTLHFKMFYDTNGHYFQTSKDRPVIKQIEMLKDGKMYDVKIQLAD